MLDVFCDELFEEGWLGIRSFVVSELKGFSEVRGPILVAEAEQWPPGAVCEEVTHPGPDWVGPKDLLEGCRMPELGSVGHRRVWLGGKGAG